MSTTQDFIEYVCEQIRGAGFVRYRKMFGEYMVYVNRILEPVTSLPKPKKKKVRE